MEALASGLPVVSTHHAGIAELIESGYNGILVDEYDWKAFSKAMKEICLDDQLIQKLGKNGRKSIESNELISKNELHLLSIIREAIDHSYS